MVLRSCPILVGFGDLLKESWNDCSVVPLHHLAFVYARYFVVVSGVIWCSAQMLWKSFYVHYGPLLVSIVDGISNFDIKWLTNIAAIAVSFVRAIGIFFLSFEYRSVFVTINRLCGMFLAMDWVCPWRNIRTTWTMETGRTSFVYCLFPCCEYKSNKPGLLRRLRLICFASINCCSLSCTNGVLLGILPTARNDKERKSLVVVRRHDWFLRRGLLALHALILCRCHMLSLSLPFQWI